VISFETLSPTHIKINFVIFAEPTIIFLLFFYGGCVFATALSVSRRGKIDTPENAFPPTFPQKFVGFSTGFPQVSS